MGYVYAVCDRCAHVECRPGWAPDDWHGCENCGAGSGWVDLCYSLEEAEDLSEEIMEGMQ